MTKRKDDNTQPPSGGRAAERLRQFEEARGLRKPGKPVEESGEAAKPEDDKSGKPASDRGGGAKR